MATPGQSSNPAKPLLRWKRAKKATGLARFAAGPPPYWLYDGETKYACVSALRHRHEVTGWYFVTGWDSSVPYQNTCNEPLPTPEEAKEAAMAVVRKHLGSKPALK